MIKPFLLLTLIGCAIDPVADEATVSADLGVLDPPTFQPLYRVRIHGIATSDTNGTNASPVTATRVANLMSDLNAVFASARIKIDFDPATDFETRASTVLNRRFGVVGSLASYTDPDVAPTTTTTAYDAARRAAADEHRDKLTIFFAAPLTPEYSSSEGHWVLVPDSAGGDSWEDLRYVSWKHDVHASNLAHELGHYLHNQHTMVKGLATVAEAGEAIAAYIDAGHPVADGLLALDNDRDYVLDTPPDAAGSIFVDESPIGDKCDPNLPSVEIPVTYGGNQHATFILEPDKSLVMSYFGCSDPQRFSGDQTQRTYDALALGNRRGLLRYMSVPAPGTSPTLAPLGEATAGTISKVKIARIGMNRVVTASVSSDILKLVVWDVNAVGELNRQGDIVVGEIGSDFEITHGGLDQVLVAYRGTGGGLGVRSYRVSSGGFLTHLDTETAGEITELALARISSIRFVTAVRLSTGTLRTIAWTVDAHGKITRRAHQDSGIVTSIEGVTAYQAASGYGATTFARDALGLSVQTWQIGSDDVAFVQVDNAGATLAAATSELDFDLAATTVRMSNNLTKVIAWKSGYDGTITRGGSASPPLACTRVASAAIGARHLVTACRGDLNRLYLRLFEVASNGTSITERFGGQFGAANELALVEVGKQRVVLATASLSGALSLRTFELTP